MKTAVIGIGVIGNVHLNILRAQNRSIVAICDTDTEKTAAFPEYAAYTDYREMIEKEKPDVVHVCTPHYLHAEMVVYALEGNIHVLCEKPLCIRREDIPAILEAEARSSAQLGVCFQNRYTPCNAFVRDYLKNKRVLSAVGTLAWQRDEAYYRSGDWRGTWECEGGGVLINQAIHTLDLLQWFVGEPQYVTAAVDNLTLQGKTEVEDTATVIGSGGANFILTATNGCATDFPVEIQMRTEREYIRVCDKKVEINGETAFVAEDIGFVGKYCYGIGHPTLMESFYDCIRTGEKFPIDGKEGAKAVRLVLAAYESNGKKVKTE